MLMPAMAGGMFMVRRIPARSLTFLCRTGRRSAADPNPYKVTNRVGDGKSCERPSRDFRTCTLLSHARPAHDAGEPDVAVPKVKLEASWRPRPT